MLLASEDIKQKQNEGADSVGGQKRGDKVAYVHNHILAESGGEGAGKRCPVSCMVLALTLGQQHFRVLVGIGQDRI